jgi:hypothetical protein
MIERHVYVKLTDASAAPALADRAVSALAALPGVREVRAALPADAGARVWDLALTLRFDTLADADAAVADPHHDAFFAAVDALAQVRKAWNFRVRG